MKKDNKIAKEEKKQELVVCPECKGEDENCSLCGGRGTVLKE
jgi:hypothetical protein